MPTPRERYLTALRGGTPDLTPFAVYENKIPQCAVERDLRNRGMVILHRKNSFRIVHPNVTQREERFFDEKGRLLSRLYWETPVGTLVSLNEPAGFTVWHHELPFKTPEDYAPLLFMLNDARVVPEYDAAAVFKQKCGEDIIVRDDIDYEPLQKIIYDYMGSLTFSFEWMENRDDIMELAAAITRLHREIYRVIADGPLLFSNYGGNVVPQMIGPKVFRELYLPAYAEAAEVLHRKGKLLGSHMDADNALIMDALGESALDFIEAYDPGVSPSVAEARKAFAGKTLSIHWPSGDVFMPYEKLVERTIGMIDQAAPGNGFIIGITEDVPPDRWQTVYRAIMAGIEARPL